MKKKERILPVKTLLLTGAAFGAYMLVASSASAAPTDCTRETVNLSPAVSAIHHCGHKLKWWGAYIVPGDANGGGGDNTTVVEKKHYCCPPPPCQRAIVSTET
jgi:hypothetical protein